MVLIFCVIHGFFKTFFDDFFFFGQIKNLAEKDIQVGKGADIGLKLGISDEAVVVFGSRAHLEKQALATVWNISNICFLFIHIINECLVDCRLATVRTTVVIVLVIIALKSFQVGWG